MVLSQETMQTQTTSQARNLGNEYTDLNLLPTSNSLLGSPISQAHLEVRGQLSVLTVAVFASIPWSRAQSGSGGLWKTGLKRMAYPCPVNWTSFLGQPQQSTTNQVAWLQHTFTSQIPGDQKSEKKVLVEPYSF